MRGRPAVLILALLALLGTSACGGDGGEGADGQVTIVFSDWHLTETHWEKSLKEAIAAFEQRHPNINVELDYVSYGEKETKYQTAMQARQGPDVVHLHAYSLRSFIDRGYLLKLDDFIAKEGGGFLDAWYPQTLELMQHEGQTFALPGDFMAMTLFYNRKHFAEAGISRAPKTWDEFLETAKKLTVDTNGDGKVDRWGFGTVGAIDPGWELRFTPFLYSFGGQYLTDDARCSALDEPEALRAIEFFTDLYTEHKVVPPGVTSQNPGTVREQLANEQVSMALGSGWTPPIVDSINPKLNAAETLETVPVPKAEGATPTAGTTAWLSAWAINANSEHPEEAWELLKFITSKEMEQKWFDDARVLSARKDVSGPGGYQALLEDKFASVVAKELENAKFVPQIPQWPQVAEVVNTAVQEVFSGKATAAEAVRSAHERVNDILGCSS